MLMEIQRCFATDRILYTRHALEEMQSEEFGEIKDQEVCEAVSKGSVIENYPDDAPYPSCLVYGKTVAERPLHMVCAYDAESDIVIIVTVYQPDPNRWIDFERRMP